MVSALLVVAQSFRLANFLLVGIFAPTIVTRFTPAGGLVLSYLTIGFIAAATGLKALVRNSSATAKIQNLLDWLALVLRESLFDSWQPEC
jgi:hypothetical protein